MMTIDELKYKLEDNSRLIGLDLGTKRVGVAISDNKRKLQHQWKLSNIRTWSF